MRENKNEGGINIFLKSFIEKNNIDAEIEYIDDLDKLLEAKILIPPAVIIDGVKKSEGKIP
ncbi:MAG: thioredoxin family protein, partial [Candidatus Atribacteria bacterium]|nr:thioredoxin family protein [Candidatus Atribacteria bacterium]